MELVQGHVLTPFRSSPALSRGSGMDALASTPASVLSAPLPQQIMPALSPSWLSDYLGCSALALLPILPGHPKIPFPRPCRPVQSPPVETELGEVVVGASDCQGLSKACPASLAEGCERWPARASRTGTDGQQEPGPAHSRLARGTRHSILCTPPNTLRPPLRRCLLSSCHRSWPCSWSAGILWTVFQALFFLS